MINIEHEDTIVRTFILFVQAARSAFKYADAHLYGKMRLSIVKLIALQALASNGGVMRPSEIAEWTQTERHNITTLINRMSQEGLVTTTRDTVNKRNVNVTLTDKGREVHKQVMLVAREVVDRVMLSINESDCDWLEKILKVIRQNSDQGLEDFTQQSPLRSH